MHIVRETLESAAFTIIWVITNVYEFHCWSSAILSYSKLHTGCPLGWATVTGFPPRCGHLGCPDLSYLRVNLGLLENSEIT